MKIMLYNSLSKKKEEFKPLGKTVGIYTCGPTVYWFAHVGNFRSFIFPDVLKRVLIYFRYDVNHIINVTDVGHLTSDRDTGEDKIEEASRKEGKSPSKISKFYFEAFKKDFKKLNLIAPENYPKATEHIKEQIEMIKVLEKKGYTYQTTDGIYFNTSKFKDYGLLSSKKAEKLIGGKRVKLGEKKNKTDFALWKFSPEKSTREQEWESPWGIGFPGWHIECSAMATKYLGKKFDIHTGGEDHLPIHHENEIAQSECSLGIRPWVNFWMHGAFLEIKGAGKMSKSSGKIKTITELEKEDIPPLAFKYFTYTAHYKKPLGWSDSAIKSAVSSYKRLKTICESLVDDKEKENKKYLIDFEKCISNDLDMPNALAVLWRLIRDKKAKGKVSTIKKMDSVFGLRLLKEEEIKIPSAVDELSRERLLARKNKNWKRSDEIRKMLSRQGWKVIDHKDSFKLEKLKEVKDGTSK